MGSRRIESSNYRNPCLTMHQPWASLLVHGIKRIEGRSWPAPIRGRLWIHAAGKVPEPETIKLMEDFYREIYAMNGVMDIKFPDHYPVSRLLGCVNVVGCVTCEELVSWEAVPTSVRVEGQTALCWLCERPQKLIVPFEMRGYQGVYNLERKIYEAAIRGLAPVKAPQPVSFLLPNPRDPFSLKPGSLASSLNHSSMKEEKPPSLVAAIAGAREAATQFSRNVNPGPPTGRGAESLRPVVEATTQFSRNVNPGLPIGREAESLRPVEATTQFSRNVNPGPPIGRGAVSLRPVEATTQFLRNVNPGPPIGRGAENLRPVEATTQFSSNGALETPIGRGTENLRPVEATTQFSRNGALETPIGRGAESRRSGEAATQFLGNGSPGSLIGGAENRRLGEGVTQFSRNGTPGPRIGRGAAWVIENHLRSARESWGKPTKS